MPSQDLGTIQQSIASAKLMLDENGSLKTHGEPIDLEAYSRMKYGVRSDLRHFAELLANTIAREAPEVFTGALPPAILTAYKAAAPPAATLGRYCLDHINLARYQHGLAPGEMVRVYRPQDYIEEYALLPLHERRKLMGHDTPNHLQGRSLEGYLPIILDDIYVTGTYTRMMQQVLHGYNNIIAAYLISCDVGLRQNPHVEHQLNTSAIRTVNDLLPYIKADNFVCSRRFLKMLLRTDSTKVQRILPKLPDALLEQVARAMVDTDSELRHIFAQNSRLILQACQQRAIFAYTSRT